MKKYILLCLMLLMSVSISLGQKLLLLEDAVQIALENNFGILVAKNDARISANNAHRGGAGLLPTVSANAGGNYNNNSTQVEFASPQFPPVDASGVVNTSYNAGLSVNYTVFDGMGNVNRFKVLKTSSDLSDSQTQAVIETTINQVANAYYAIARQLANYKTLEESIDISQQRMERAENQFAFGSSNKLAILNAEVDFNTDSANLALAYYNLENAKRSLNALIGQDIVTDFSINEDVTFKNLNLNDLMTMAENNNSQLRIAAYNRQISELNVKIAKASYAPVIGVNAGYNFLRSDNGVGSILKSQQNLGLALGATLNIPIYSGNTRKVNVQNTEIAVLNSQHRYDETKLNLERDISNSYYTYQGVLTQLKLEQTSLASAEENFERTEDAFKLGQATNVQFRDAQLNLIRVKNRINDLRFTAKLNELELLRLSGQLSANE